VEALAVTPVIRGRLRAPSDAPAVGERTEAIAELGGVAVEQTLSGALEAPVDYNQDHDEWVVLLVGRATLVVGDESLDLAPGEWVFLRAREPHRLVETEPGTSWLALHAPPAPFPG
jgi:cupin 2 domain-containing protein